MFVMENFQELEMEADAETGSAIGLGWTVLASQASAAVENVWEIYQLMWMNSIASLLAACKSSWRTVKTISTH